MTDLTLGALVGLLTRKDLLQVRVATIASEGERRAFFGTSRPKLAPLAGR